MADHPTAPRPAPVATPDAPLRQELKLLVVESARLKVGPETISDEEPLFGGRLGLDSLDALQLAVAVDERFSVQIPDDEEGRAAFRSIAALAGFIGRARPG
jgi:acyl carrier protein